MRKKHKKRYPLDIDWNAFILFFFVIFCVAGLTIWTVSELRENANKEPTKQGIYAPNEIKGETENPEEAGGVDPMETYDELPEQKYIGKCRLTVYTPYCDNGKWGYQTATGADSQHLMTCAVDPNVIPYGSNVIIRKGDDEIRLKAIDCGSAVEGKHIDIFYDGREAAAVDWLDYNFGDYAEVWIETIETIE